MPTREEIAEWLREAETLAKIWRNECDVRGLPKQASGIDQDAQLFRKRAAQVEAMRCETCVRAEQAAVPYCNYLKMSVYRDFHCAKHEPKV